MGHQSTGEGGAATAPFRADIEGMRAISVIAVVVYHAFPAWLPGGFTGVDVFFVISGYLITRLLLAEWGATGRLDLSGFWARRIRRILPIASLVLVVSIGLILAIPALDARALAPHAIAAALFVHNLHQAREAVDYLGAAHGHNPLLHYWSLSVEEQFYVLWPLMLVGLLMLARRRASPRLVLMATLALAAASFAFNVGLTARDPALAFFHPLGRAWQLWIGAALALSEPMLAARLRAVAPALAALGAAGLAASFALLTTAVAYPGALALVPTLSAAALIAAHTARATAVGKGLSMAPMRWVGRLSFGWYLWHWPVLVFGRLLLGTSLATDLGLIALSLALAAVTYRWVEAPARHGRLFHTPRWRAYALGASLVALPLALGIGVRHLAPDWVVVGDGQYASASAVKRDRPVVYDDGCLLRFADVEQPPCIYGVADASRTVVLVGDSHGGNWFPALERAATEAGWRLVVRLKAACPPLAAPARVTEAGRERAYHECDTWRAATLNEIERLRPALIVVGSTRHQDPIEAERAVLSRLAAIAPTVAVRGTPWLGEDALACLRRTRDPAACQWPLASLLARHNYPKTPTAQLPSGVRVLDLNAELCPRGICAAVREGSVMMFDQHHLTATTARRFSDRFRALLTSAPP